MAGKKARHARRSISYLSADNIEFRWRLTPTLRVGELHARNARQTRPDSCKKDIRERRCKFKFQTYIINLQPKRNMKLFLRHFSRKGIYVEIIYNCLKESFLIKIILFKEDESGRIKKKYIILRGEEVL